jgi:hypothetical protein
MKLTRDSLILTLTIIAASATVPLAHFDKIPWLTQSVQQTVELVAAAAGIVAGILRTSPLNISLEGHVKEQQAKTEVFRAEAAAAPYVPPQPEMSTPAPPTA